MNHAEKDAHGMVVVDEVDIRREEAHRACEEAHRACGIRDESGVHGAEARKGCGAVGDRNEVHITGGVWDCFS